MGLTNFPDGINAGSVVATAGLGANAMTIGTDGVAPYATANGARVAAGTAIVTGGSVDVDTGLTTVTFAVASPYGLLDAPGTALSFANVSAEAGTVGGTVIVRAFDNTGTASASAGTAAWWAVGT